MPQVHQKKMATCCRCQIRYHRGSKPWFLCKDPLNSRVDPRPQKKGDQNWTVDAAGKILQLKKSQRLVEIYPVKNPLVIYIYVLDLLHELAKSQHFLAAWHQLACTLQAAAVHVVFFFLGKLLAPSYRRCRPPNTCSFARLWWHKKGQVFGWSLLKIWR